MKNTETTKQVQMRFFAALDSIIAMQRIRGVATYCRLNGIDRRNLITQRKNPERGFFQVSWLVPMVKDYGISARWLLLGVGKMLEDD